VHTLVKVIDKTNGYPLFSLLLYSFLPFPSSHPTEWMKNLNSPSFVYGGLSQGNESILSVAQHTQSDPFDNDIGYATADKFPE
jgi:hypothetical protein